MSCPMGKETFLNIAHINVRSLRYKVDDIKLLLDTYHYDILAITETFLDSTQLNINNYRLIRRDRPNGSGGGCMFYVADHLNVQHQKCLDVNQVEALWIKVNTGRTMILMGVVYRPPNDNEFFTNFCAATGKKMAQISKHYRTRGLQSNCDLNYTSTGSSSHLGNKLLNLLNQYALNVHNNTPTRITSNSATLIDLIISNKSSLVRSTGGKNLGISDHNLVHAIIDTKIRRPPPNIITARNYKNLNLKNFRKDLEDAPCSICHAFQNPDDTYWAWSQILTDICNKHAPYRSFKARSQSLPWITPQLRHKMNQRYKLYRTSIKTNDAVIWKQYKDLRNQLTTEVRKAKANYYKTQFDEVKDVKSYWRLINETSSCPPWSSSIKAIR